MNTISPRSRMTLAASYALLILLPCLLIVLLEWLPQSVVVGGVPELRVCVVAHLLLGPLVTRGHGLPLSGHFRSLGRHCGCDAVAASTVEGHSDCVALHALAASDFG